ncbi:MAG: hypothetical protein J6D27_02035 [Ruminiclostridium sp.]|nr:hypothetical protein [Ruminiclostridium sp.]
MKLGQALMLAASAAAAAGAAVYAKKKLDSKEGKRESEKSFQWKTLPEDKKNVIIVKKSVRTESSESDIKAAEKPENEIVSQLAKDIEIVSTQVQPETKEEVVPVSEIKEETTSVPEVTEEKKPAPQKKQKQKKYYAPVDFTFTEEENEAPVSFENVMEHFKAVELPDEEVEEKEESYAEIEEDEKTIFESFLDEPVIESTEEEPVEEEEEVIQDDNEQQAFRDFASAVAPVPLVVNEVTAIPESEAERITSESAQIPSIDEIPALAVETKTEETIAEESVQMPEAVEAPVAEEVIETPVAVEVAEAPVVEEVAEAPVVEEVIEAPVAEEVVEAPVAEEVIETPVAEEVAEAPVVEEVAEAPVAVEVTEAPVVEEVAEAPVVEEVAEAPVVEEVAEAPVAVEVAEAPVVEEVVEAPVAVEVAEAPVVEEVVEAPVAEEVAEAPVVEEVVEAPVAVEVAEAPVAEETIKIAEPAPFIEENLGMSLPDMDEESDGTHAAIDSMKDAMISADFGDLLTDIAVAPDAPQRTLDFFDNPEEDELKQTVSDDEVSMEDLFGDLLAETEAKTEPDITNPSEVFKMFDTGSVDEDDFDDYKDEKIEKAQEMISTSDTRRAIAQDIADNIELFAQLLEPLNAIKENKVRVKSGIIFDWEMRIQSLIGDPPIKSYWRNNFVNYEIWTDEKYMEKADELLSMLQLVGVVRDNVKEVVINRETLEFYSAQSEQMNNDFNIGETAVVVRPCWKINGRPARKGEITKKAPFADFSSKNVSPLEQMLRANKCDDGDVNIPVTEDNFCSFDRDIPYIKQAINSGVCKCAVRRMEGGTALAFFYEVVGDGDSQHYEACTLRFEATIDKNCKIVGRFRGEKV